MGQFSLLLPVAQSFKIIHDCLLAVPRVLCARSVRFRLPYRASLDWVELGIERLISQSLGEL